MSDRAPGRPRDGSIDDRVLAVAAAHLARHGYDGMSVVAVAEEAGTTRQALYRRWPSKADLATASIAALAAFDRQPPTGDAYSDLLRELRSFQRGVSRPDGLSMVGTMLHAGTDPELVRLYRERIVAPRRAALRQILEDAVASGELPPDADLDVATAMLTGNWYARALAGDAPPRRWAERTVELVWRGLAGRGPRRSAPGDG